MKLDSTQELTLLIVDDDHEDRLLFTDAITEVSSRIAINFCTDADELVEAVKRIQPNLIFMDYMMPKKTGIEAMQLLKSYPDFFAIPIVMWGTSNLPVIVEAAYEAGAQHFQEKPYQIKEWVCNIKKILYYLFGEKAPIPATC